MLESEQKGLDMTPETKTYFDAHFKHLEQRIEYITTPIKETLADHRKNFLEVYARLTKLETEMAVLKDNKENLQTDGRLGKIEKDVAILKDNKGSRQNNSTTILAVITIVAGIFIGIMGFLL